MGGTASPEIRFEAVTKTYGDGPPAVGGLDLTVPAGKITVLAGPSGCGKTTSLRMVNRLVAPSSGRVWLGERDVAAVPAAELRRGIGYVIQQVGLFPHRTVADNVATVPLLLGVSRRQARRDALAVLERVGLDPALGRRYPAQLSGGQQQRVGVARALAADPPVLLMDEPFSAVDPVVRGQLQEELLRLQADLRKTILVVTHDIDEAIRVGDVVAVLRDGGTLAQVAAPAEVLHRPADAFVAAFLGRDRGYRALAFAPADGVPLDAEPAIVLGQPAARAAGAARDGWVLVVDAGHRPQGWLAVPAPPDSPHPPGPMLHPGGTLATTGGSLRSLLDAALSSPSGRGVVVDGDGRLAGTVRAEAVLARLRPDTRRDHPDRAAPA